MKNIIRVAAACLLLLVWIASCSGSHSFTIKGTLAGGETQSMRFIYYSGRALQNVHVAAREGSFEMKGNSEEPTLVDIVANDGRIIARVLVKNGETIKCSLNRRAPWEIEMEGNDADERWAAFIRDNSDAFRSDDAEPLNQLIEKYVAEHPDDIVSTLLTVTAYRTAGREKEAAALLGSIAEEARPAAITDPFYSLMARYVAATDSLGDIRFYLHRDSFPVIRPSEAELTLVVLSESQNGVRRPDSVIDFLRSIRKAHKDTRLQIADLSVDVDTFTWRRTINTDSATWLQGWAQGGILNEGLQYVAVDQLPFFIVADSTGRSLYAGSEATAAADTVKIRLK